MTPSADQIVASFVLATCPLAREVRLYRDWDGCWVVVATKRPPLREHGVARIGRDEIDRAVGSIYCTEETLSRLVIRKSRLAVSNLRARIFRIARPR